MAVKKWYKLDNAAIIVPSTAKGSDTRVFRIVCELKEEVRPDHLQEALDLTLTEYPHFRCVLRRGLFWYYLDASDIRPLVAPDDLPACSAIYFQGRRNLLFRVTYFHTRINLEMFHVLSDGTGALVFLESIITNYLKLAHDIKGELEVRERSSSHEKTDDSFKHFYDKSVSAAQLKEMTSQKAFQIKGPLDENLETHCLEGTVSAAAFIDIAHRYNTTAGILSTSLFVQAILDGMSVREQKRPIVISVPVNLRQFFQSSTTRNFFGVINISFNADEYDGTLDSIIASISESFKKQLTKENIMNTMNSYSALTHNIAIKLVPLFLKDLCIEFFSGLAASGITATMSNLGRIELPAEIAGYVDRFSAFMATPNMQICVATYNDKLTFGVSSAFEEHFIMLNFFRRLTSFGLDVELATNDYNTVPEQDSFISKVMQQHDQHVRNKSDSAKSSVKAHEKNAKARAKAHEENVNGRAKTHEENVKGRAKAHEKNVKTDNKNNEKR